MGRYGSTGKFSRQYATRRQNAGQERDSARPREKKPVIDLDHPKTKAEFEKRKAKQYKGGWEKYRIEHRIPLEEPPEPVWKELEFEFYVKPWPPHHMKVRPKPGIPKTEIIDGLFYKDGVRVVTLREQAEDKVARRKAYYEKKNADARAATAAKRAEKLNNPAAVKKRKEQEEAAEAAEAARAREKLLAAKDAATKKRAERAAARTEQESRDKKAKTTRGKRNYYDYASTEDDEGSVEDYEDEEPPRKRTEVEAYPGTYVRRSTRGVYRSQS